MTEVQKFNSILGYVILAVVAAINYIAASNGASYDKYTYLLSVVPALLVWALLEFSKLSVYYGKEGITFKFPPLHRHPRNIAWSEIKDIEVKEYRPIKEFGGWGWRKNSKGKAYTTKGKNGVFITTKTGEQIMIGTQSPEEIRQQIAAHFK